ncbi:MAG: rhomboid family intramembrane serine protease [Bifidobacteriaceae bacterium]|jgi:membrane associated rhomboid family serine protease|nr:rhomboid family intramembrane serine protease [Bifidobacteriaceae bacterium]
MTTGSGVGEGAAGPGPAGVPECPKHPGAPAMVRCQRCRRPVCPACQVPAAVGVQCPECVRAGNRSRPVARSVFGAPLTGGMPVVTVGAIALCVLAYLGQALTRGALTNDWIMAPAVVWIQPWRLVTAGFLHGGVAHLLLNMYALWVVGSFVEQLIGRWRFAALYLASVVGGHAAVLIYTRLFDCGVDGILTGTEGASGAVFGLFAAAFVLSRRLGGEIRGIAGVIGLNLVLGVVIGGISWQAHIGGLLTGAAMAAVYAYAPRGRRRLYAWFAIGGAVIVMAGIVIATYGPWLPLVCR